MITSLNIVSDDIRLEEAGIRLPLVSVIVTNYNYANYICDCLESIKRQDYTNIECLVVDDKSTDNSVEIINKFSKDTETEIQLVEHDQNRGQFAAFSTGLLHAKGEFIVFVDADDILLGNFVSEHLRIHLGDYPVAFTSSNQYQINGEKQVIAGIHSFLQAVDIEVIIRSQPLLFRFWPWATTSTMMFRRTILELILLDSSCKLMICADNYLCHFANLIGESVIIPQKLGCYRRHGKNNFASNSYVNNRTLIGDMSNHPEHGEVLTLIRKEILDKSDLFLKIFSFTDYSKLLLKTTSIINLSESLLFLLKVRQGSRFPVLFRLICIYLEMMWKALYRILIRKITFQYTFYENIRPQI